MSRKLSELNVQFTKKVKNFEIKTNYLNLPTT